MKKMDKFSVLTICLIHLILQHKQKGGSVRLASLLLGELATLKVVNNVKSKMIVDGNGNVLKSNLLSDVKFKELGLNS